MDIKILDSHLREHLETKAKPADIAKALSLTSASIERVEPYGDGDVVYSVEVTTNRPDMVSVRGLAREAATVLPTFGYEAKLVKLSLPEPKQHTTEKATIHVVNNDKLVRRICGVVLEVTMKESPQYIKDRLEAAGIRSLNNLIDITNYVMLEMGHPCHAFDYDRLHAKKLLIRESKKGEKLITLDKKEHTLAGGDIVADDGNGTIIDLLGVMGTENSVVTDKTARILFFFDNNDPWRIRKTSMGLAIRTDAAALNEKGVDPELAMDALKRGVVLYKEFADAKVASDVIDIYPGKVKEHTVSVDKKKITDVIGIDIPVKQSIKILTSLGFDVTEKENALSVKVPTWRENDIVIAEDVIEEIARMYGYHNLPTALPPYTWHTPYHQNTNPFYWEQRAKEALKQWGFTETYTYATVSETLFEGPLEEAVTLKNPLDSDHVYLRKTLTPSLLQVIHEHKTRENIQIFEIANVYHKNRKEKLPMEVQTLAFVIKGEKKTYYHAKGYVEALLAEFGIEKATYDDPKLGGIGSSILIDKEYAGEIEVVTDDTVCAELNFDLLLKHATAKKTYTPIPKYPPIEEDLALTVDVSVKTGDIIKAIQKQSSLIVKVELLDIYKNSRTFHIVYQDETKNLTTEEVKIIREKIISYLQEKLSGTIK